jgi:hypothetical protein
VRSTRGTLFRTRSRGQTSEDERIRHAVPLLHV